MSEQVTMTVHSIAEDGLPDMDDDNLTGQVAFIFDGCIVSGWPLKRVGYPDDTWEANSDVGHNRPMAGVTHWVEFPEPIWNYERRTTELPAPAKTPSGGRLNRDQIDVLGRYNAEVARGLVHTDAWRAEMAELRRRFDDATRPE